MAAGTTPIFPKAPLVGVAQLTNATGTAITNGTKITGTTGLVQLVATQTDGCRIDRITCRVAGTAVGLNAASQVWVWINDGTTSWLFDELLIPAVTSTASTVAGATVEEAYANLALPSTHSLYISTTVTPTDASGMITVTANGGIY